MKPPKPADDVDHLYLNIKPKTSKWFESNKKKRKKFTGLQTKGHI